MKENQTLFGFPIKMVEHKEKEEEQPLFILGLPDFRVFIPVDEDGKPILPTPEVEGNHDNTEDQDEH